MLRLEFNDFQKKIEEDKLVSHVSTIHCMITANRFVFVMKSREKWDYYTIMLFETINQYALENNIDPTEAFDMFVTNYVNNTLRIFPSEDMEESSNPDSEPEEIAIEKEIITKPQAVEDCVQSLLSDPDFHAYPGKTREESAYAICYSRNKKSPGNQDNHDKPLNGFTPKSSSTSDIIDSGNTMVDEADGYSDFLFKFFSNMEKKVLRNIGDIKNEVGKSYTEKTFGEFLRNLFNIVNTKAFANNVRKYIKSDIVTGITSAEAELNVDIGFNDEFQDKVNQLASQQIDGYIIDGKKWPGIKGVTKEIQAEVIMIVQNGINKQSSLAEITAQIKTAFDSFSDWRSEMIGRTETTRITNEGKILGYKESGIKGKKVWSAALDSRTSPICRRLNGQQRDLDDYFIDPETNKAYFAPPSHPNCRSTIFLRTKT